MFKPLCYLPLFLLPLAMSACRTLNDEAACERDRDCPESLPFCGASRDDAGVGLCVDEATPSSTLDAGPADFGEMDAEETDAGEITNED